MARQPWHTLVRPVLDVELGGKQVQLYGFSHTSLHRLRADTLILTCDHTLRMVKGTRKQVRDYGGQDLIEREAARHAPLEPGGVAVTSGGRTKFKQVLHANIFDAQITTAPHLQSSALKNAFQAAAGSGAKTIAIVDYTPDLRRALAEETAYLIANAIVHSPDSIKTVRILCFDPVNAWVFNLMLKWIKDEGFVPYPGCQRVRHTMLHIYQPDKPGFTVSLPFFRKPHILSVPSDALLHATTPDLHTKGIFARGAALKPKSNVGDLLNKYGGRQLRAWMREAVPVELGSATYTRGGKLPYPWVLHLAVHDEQHVLSEALLAKGVHHALELAHAQNLKTLLVPPLDLQEDGLSQEAAARTVVDTLGQYLHSVLSKIERVILYAENDAQEACWRKAVNLLTSRTDLPALEMPEEAGFAGEKQEAVPV